MIVEQLLSRSRVGLLVSVRSADEALAALAGGADVIDVKEPDRGALGAADFDTISDIVRAVDRRVPVTAAAGELRDLVGAGAASSCRPMPAGIALVKVGLAHCGPIQDWRYQWRTALAALRRSDDAHHARPVAVVYADWRAAGAPPPEEIYSAAVDIQAPVFLIDTWDKTGGSLFERWPLDELGTFVDCVRRGGQAVVLAGSLSDQNLLLAAGLGPNLLAVRGAACDAGRRANVSRKRVAELQRLMSASPFLVAPGVVGDAGV